MRPARELTQPGDLTGDIEPAPKPPTDGPRVQASQAGAEHGPRAGWSKKRVGCVIGLALLIGAPLAATALLDASGTGGGGGVEALGFGSGGSGCGLENAASSFATGVPVHFVAQFTPALPAGDTVTITLSEGGTELVSRDGTIKLDVPQDCVSGTWPDLAAGHYSAVVSSSISIGMPPVSGEFEVTQ